MKHLGSMISPSLGLTKVPEVVTVVLACLTPVRTCVCVLVILCVVPTVRYVVRSVSV